jgi:hypothetical protein
LSLPSLAERRISLCADRWAEAAFRAALASAPEPHVVLGPDDSDVLEVGDLEGAIAQAEDAIRERKPTDDCAGPAIAAVSVTAPILVLDEAAFNYPAGRLIGFGERSPEVPPKAGRLPVWQLGEAERARQLRERRRLLAWVVLGILAPVLLLLVFELCASFGARLG